MKGLVLTGIAALLMATSAVHAQAPASEKWEADGRMCYIHKWFYDQDPLVDVKSTGCG
jgi:hypothetical protein